MNVNLVSICENQGFCIRGDPIRKFFSQDGIHLSNEGLKIFAANIKSSVGKCLKLDLRQVTRKVDSGSRNGYRHATHRDTYRDNRHQYQNNARHNERADTFQSEKDIAMYSTLGKIVLAGDLNARTGSGELDFIDNDSQDNLIPLYDNYNPDYDISVRHSKDVHLSTRGKLLNDICVQTGLRILNGRTRGDFIGQLTCHNPRGSSVVDYFIVSEELLDKVAFF
ncbi:unnamed protein product [Mytilus edulis]|nr:unnamed protein product [Mytilus edulis]